MTQVMEKKQYSSERMEEWKKDVVEYQIFETMVPEQQEELFNVYINQFKPKELAELWGCKTQNIYNIKSRLKLAKRKKDVSKKEVTKSKGEVAVNSSPVKNKPKKSISEMAMEVAEAFREAKEKEKGEAVQKAPVVQQPTVDIPHILEEVRGMMQEELNEFKKTQPIPLTSQNLYDALELMIDQKKEEEEEADGFAFKFSGIHDAAKLSKKLKKVLALIEGEDSQYEIQFSIMERPQVLEAEVEEVKEDETDLLREKNEEMQAQLQKLQQELEEEKKKDKWQEGYQTLKNEKQGLHHPKSEYQKDEKKKEAMEEQPRYSGIINKDGRPRYQTFYICPGCGHKDKHYLHNGTIYCNCHECGKRMRMREAVKGSLLEADTFGNFFVAGKFKREDEFNKDKPLVELWNIQ